MLPGAQCRLYMCSCVCFSSTACFCAGFCDVGLNLQSCYLKPTSATQREFAQPKANNTHPTHIPLQTHRNHTLAFILNGHMSYFHSTHPTLVALSLSISPTHTHMRYNNTSAGEASLPTLLSGYSKSCKWHDRLLSLRLYTFN